MVVHDVDLQHLRRCSELARIALKAGHGPFGAMLVGANGQTLYEDHNRVTDDDQTLHAELGVIRWAVANLAPVQRIRATLYTSCEHLPDVCGHARVGGAGAHRVRDVERSADRLADRMGRAGTAGRHAAGPRGGAQSRVDGPAPELEEEIKALYEVRYRR